MKIVFSILAFFILSTKECDTNSANTDSEEIQKQEQVTFEYKAISRGTFYHIIIDKNTVSVQKDSNGEMSSKTCSKDDWAKLIAILESINIEEIPALESPTKARLYDGAAAAQLRIIIDKSTYKTQSFDHGAPPKEIESLINTLLTIAENIE